MATTFKSVSNHAGGTLNAGISDVATSLTLGSGQGAAFPSSGSFWLVVYVGLQSTANEIMLCTSRTGDTLTVTRAQQGTSAAAWEAGAIVQGVWTKTAIEDIHNAINGIENGTTTLTKVVIGAGTALLPSLAPTGDANTGVWFPAADTVAFSCGGVQRIRIDSSGRVGIGADPTANAKLNVYNDSTSSCRMRFGNQEGNIDLIADGGASGFYHEPSLAWRFLIAATGEVTIYKDLSCLEDLTVAGYLDTANYIEAGNSTNTMEIAQPAEQFRISGAAADLTLSYGEDYAHQAAAGGSYSLIYAPCPLMTPGTVVKSIKFVWYLEDASQEVGWSGFSMDMDAPQSGATALFSAALGGVTTATGGGNALTNISGKYYSKTLTIGKTINSGEKLWAGPTIKSVTTNTHCRFLGAVWTFEARRH